MGHFVVRCLLHLVGGEGLFRVDDVEVTGLRAGHLERSGGEPTGRLSVLVTSGHEVADVLRDWGAVKVVVRGVRHHLAVGDAAENALAQRGRLACLRGTAQWNPGRLSALCRGMDQRYLADCP